MEIIYKIIYSKRKTISLSVNKNGEVIVRAGFKTDKNFIENFVEKHKKWIIKHRQFISERLVNEQIFTQKEIEKLKSDAKGYLTQRTQFYSEIINVKPTAIKINSAKTRWGSCSGKNSINYSYRVMLLPFECIDYIIVHELCHVKIKNHSAEFYKEVAKYIPRYKEIQKKLRI